MPRLTLSGLTKAYGKLTVVDGVGSLDEVFTRITEALAPAKEVG